MRNFIASKTARYSTAAGTLVGTALVASPSMAAAPAYDLAPISTGFTDQVQGALTIGLPIAAGLIALSVGIAWVRKLLKSK
jgi:hypothetical protein